MVIPGLIGGMVGGYVVRGGRMQPVDIPSAIEILRRDKPKTYDVIQLDMAEAREDVPLEIVGDWLAIKNITNTVDLKVRLNEVDRDQLNLTRLRHLKQLYYRLYLTNEAGEGQCELYSSLGGEFYPPDSATFEQESIVFSSGILADRPAASIQDRLYWATDVHILYRDTGPAWEHVGSLILSDAVASRPAASQADRYFFATDEKVLYHDTGAAWVKISVEPVTQITVSLDGGGRVLETGIRARLPVRFDATITRGEIVSDQTGSIVVDIWKDSFANYPPTDADSITALAPLTISNGIKAEDGTLTGWTTSISEGEYLFFNIDSVSAIQNATITLTVTRT